ncbi:PH domain-containing protein [Rubripirellula lacrimiformis]|uniref:PH domain-containing protein n=1 Tax=Rubripirellula lacrimiformis TaxID=1930273 RepID=UPI001FE57248|nr:PH domain-containing protein [Rubripirellula lacrimiformis]
MLDLLTSTNPREQRLNDRAPETTASPPNDRRPVVYESAIDRWVVALLLLTPLASLGLGLYAIVIGQPGDAAILFSTGALASLVSVAFALPCRYTVLDDAVSIRCGLICYQVPLADIVSAEPTSTLRSGPALSLRRVAIKTHKRTIIVSPKDRDAFITDILTTND